MHDTEELHRSDSGAARQREDEVELGAGDGLSAEAGGRATRTNRRFHIGRRAFGGRSLIRSTAARRRCDRLGFARRNELGGAVVVHDARIVDKTLHLRDTEFADGAL